METCASLDLYLSLDVVLILLSSFEECENIEIYCYSFLIGLCTDINFCVIWYRVTEQFLKSEITALTLLSNKCENFHSISMLI